MKRFWKKAKSMLKRIGELFKGVSQRREGRIKVVGNYRNRRKWSQQAKEFAEQPRVWLADPLTEKAFFFADGVVEYYKSYSGKYQLQAANLALSLIRDIYTPDVLPVIPCGRMLSDRESIKLMNDELFELLCQYGGMDFVFREKGKSVSRKVTRDVGLGVNFFLTKKRYGIPVRMFLLWYKGEVEIPSEVLTEWSGIPERYFRIAYRELVHYFRQILKQKHREQILMNNIPSESVKLKDPNVLYV